MKTIEHLLEITGITIDELAERSKLPRERIEAIGSGRWTPSPKDRARIAAALEVSVEEVSWGHSMAPRNIQYHRFGLREDFSSSEE